MLPVLILIIIFCYVPMYGIVIAFQDYTPGSPFIGDNVKWVGLKHFMNFVQGEYFWRLIKSTLVLNLLGFERQNYRISPDAFPIIYTVTNVWKSFGFGSILYFSTISSIDPGLYESAKLDGANR